MKAWITAIVLAIAFVFIVGAVGVIVAQLGSKAIFGLSSFLLLAIAFRVLLLKE